jgi:hypothetical protein
VHERFDADQVLETVQRDASRTWRWSRAVSAHRRTHAGRIVERRLDAGDDELRSPRCSRALRQENLPALPLWHHRALLDSPRASSTTLDPEDRRRDAGHRSAGPSPAPDPRDQSAEDDRRGRAGASGEIVSRGRIVDARLLQSPRRYARRRPGSTRRAAAGCAPATIGPLSTTRAFSTSSIARRT